MSQSAENVTPYDYIWSLCQTCGDGVYVLTEQGVECDRCFGVAGIAGALPPIPYRVIPREASAAQAWDEGFAARAEYDERRDVPINWPDLNPYRVMLPAKSDGSSA